MIVLIFRLSNHVWGFFFCSGEVNVPNRTIEKVVTIPRVCGPHSLNLPVRFWTLSGTIVVLFRSGVLLAIWPFYIYIRAQTWKGVSTSILILSSKSRQIFFVVLKHIAEVFEKTDANFKLHLSQWKKVCSASSRDASA